MIEQPNAAIEYKKWKNEWKCPEERDAQCAGLLWFRSHTAPSSCALRAQTGDLIFEFFQCVCSVRLPISMIDERYCTSRDSRAQKPDATSCIKDWYMTPSHLCDNWIARTELMRENLSNPSTVSSSVWQQDVFIYYISYIMFESIFYFFYKTQQYTI